MGSIDYMAPEQGVNAKDVDERADIYSLGCTLYFLITSSTPYRGTSKTARLIAHREQPIPKIAEYLPDVPAALDQVLQTCLAKDREDRFSNMAELIGQLEACQTLIPESLQLEHLKPSTGTVRSDTSQLIADTQPYEHSQSTTGSNTVVENTEQSHGRQNG